MPKRVYTPKVISPEVARENEISAAKANVYYAQKYLKDCQSLVAHIQKHGIVDADIFGDAIDMDDAMQRVKSATADLALAEAVLLRLYASDMLTGVR